VKKTSLEKRSPTALKEKGQYALAFGVIALMLYVVGFPVLILAFFWRAITGSLRTEARPIFEFYLLANEILREDGRRWFGFEIKDTIERGEGIVHSMATAPPLVHFTLGALYQRMGDHTLAIKHLAESIEGTSADESSIVFPTPELRDYARLLRKIERAPAESPQTSAAIRSLERLRKNRGPKMLDDARRTTAGAKALEAAEDEHHFGTGSSSDRIPSSVSNVQGSGNAEPMRPAASVVNFEPREEKAADTPKPVSAVTRRNPVAAAPGSDPTQTDDAPATQRKTISEVLHDIYDEQTG
jgi:hypothetical protein